MCAAYVIFTTLRSTTARDNTVGSRTGVNMCPTLQLHVLMTQLFPQQRSAACSCVMTQMVPQQCAAACGVITQPMHLQPIEAQASSGLLQGHSALRPSHLLRHAAVVLMLHQVWRDCMPQRCRGLHFLHHSIVHLAQLTPRPPRLLIQGLMVPVLQVAFIVRLATNLWQPTRRAARRAACVRSQDCGEDNLLFLSHAQKRD
jgi:hypothetical protein